MLALRIRIGVMVALVLLGGALLSGTRSTAAQQPTPAFATLTGTVYYLVDQTIVDGVVVHEEKAPVTNGRVTILELNVSQPLAKDGTFTFSNLTLPQDPMLVSYEIRAEGYRPTTWANMHVLTARSAPILTLPLEPGDEPKLIDWCPDLLARPQEDLSAVGHQHAEFCSQLPKAGGGGPMGGSGAPVGALPLVLALVGAVLVGVGTMTHRLGRAT